MSKLFDWMKFGKDYGEVDGNLGGLPGFLREIGRRWKENKGGPVERLLGVGEDPRLVAAQKYFGNPVSAGITGAANMALGGLPAQVAKQIAPEYAARQAATRKENPIATGIGQGAGLAGAVLAPAGAAGAGMQLGPAGAKLGTTLARNALISSAYAAPAAGAEAMETGNIPKATLHGAIGTVVGTGLGTLGEMIAPAIQRAATNARLRGWGIRPADIRKSLRGGARAAGVTGEGAQSMAIKQAAGLRDQLDDLIAKFGAGPKGAAAFKQSVSSGYKNLGELYDRAGIKGADLLNDIIADPRLVGLKTDYPQLAGQIDDEILAMASHLDRGTWRNAYAGWLKEAAQKGRAAQDIVSPAAIRGQVAQAFRDKMGQAAEVIRAQAGTGQSLGELNRLVGAEHAVKGPVERAAVGVGMGAREGSQTSPRLLTAIGPKQLGGAAIGMGTGAAVGEKPKRGADALDWLKYGGRIVGSGLLGGALGRAGARTANALAVPLLSGAAKAMPLIAGAGRAAGAMGAALPALETGPQATPLARAMSGQSEAVEPAEAQAGPVKVEQAKQATNEAFSGRVMEALRRDWEAVNAEAAGTPYEMSFEDFAAKVREITNDFDPKLAAPILFRDPEERSRYLKTYESALTLGGMNVESAFGGTGLLDENRRQNQLARQTLQNWMVNLLGGPEKMADPRLQALVEQDVAALSRLPSEDRGAALRNLLQTNYGLDFNLLNQYGLGGVA